MDPTGAATLSAHPARFSPDDKYSRHRVTLKKRFGILKDLKVWKFMKVYRILNIIITLSSLNPFDPGTKSNVPAKIGATGEVSVKLEYI